MITTESKLTCSHTEQRCEWLTLVKLIQVQLHAINGSILISSCEWVLCLYHLHTSTAGSRDSSNILKRNSSSLFCKTRPLSWPFRDTKQTLYKNTRVHKGHHEPKTKVIATHGTDLLILSATRSTSQSVLLEVASICMVVVSGGVVRGST